MKKLNGLKKDFSSFENRKLKDLKSVKGGLGSMRASYSNAVGEGCYDHDFYSDDSGTGQWTYEGRIVSC